jgi:hypothetical protein
VATARMMRFLRRYACRRRHDRTAQRT